MVAQHYPVVEQFASGCDRRRRVAYASIMRILTLLAALLTLFAALLAAPLAASPRVTETSLDNGAGRVVPITGLPMPAARKPLLVVTGTRDTSPMIASKWQDHLHAYTLATGPAWPMSGSRPITTSAGFTVGRSCRGQNPKRPLPIWCR